MELTITSPQFIVFVGVCLVVLSLTKSVSRQRWLLILFSYIFCLSVGVIGAVVVTSTALIDFTVGRRLEASAHPSRRSQWLCVSIAVNLGVLIFFKYSQFLSETLSDVLHPLGLHVIPVRHVPLPLGVSYFTFAGMSYVLDIYYERDKPATSISEYVCYLIFFPKFVVGPIVRAVDLLPQFRRHIGFSEKDFETGCCYLLVGAVKKLVIADRLAGHVGMIFAAPSHYNSFTLVQGMLGYTVQIYADFAGYSDMAIGCARLMGIKFPQNFLMPYSSVNIAEFWRRWHVTLSTWFRDYVFLPLEFGSRGTGNANSRMSRNLVITMLLCGFWHGASWNFVIWGGVHGVALATYQVYTGVRRRTERYETLLNRSLRTFTARAMTLSVIMFGWIIFGTSTLRIAFQYLIRMLTWHSDGVALGSPYILPLTALMIIVHLLIDKDRNVVEELATRSIQTRVFAYSVLLLTLCSLTQSDSVPFMYVQF